jgi:hypothetical protein
LSAVENLKIRIFKNVILPVLLYGCETWSLTLREEHRLRVFENRVLRRIFRPKRNEVTGGWRKLLNSPSISIIIKSRRMRLTGLVARMAEKGMHMLFVEKPEGKRVLGRVRCRWVDNIRMALGEIGWGGYGLDRSGSG